MMIFENCMESISPIDNNKMKEEREWTISKIFQEISDKIFGLQVESPVSGTKH
jgi:hypothetical protein